MSDAPTYDELAWRLTGMQKNLQDAHDALEMLVEAIRWEAESPIFHRSTVEKMADQQKEVLNKLKTTAERIYQSCTGGSRG